MCSIEVASLIAANGDWMLSVAVGMTRNRFDADDLVGEAALRMLQSCYDPSREFRPWAKTIMLNTWRMELRHRQCIRFRSIEDAFFARSGSEADSLALSSALLSLIGDCASRSVCIECVMMYAIGYSYAEIAARLGISIGTVKRRIHDGRAMLRKALEG